MPKLSLSPSVCREYVFRLSCQQILYQDILVALPKIYGHVWDKTAEPGRGQLDIQLLLVRNGIMWHISTFMLFLAGVVMNVFALNVVYPSQDVQHFGKGTPLSSRFSFIFHLYAKVLWGMFFQGTGSLVWRENPTWRASFDSHYSYAPWVATGLANFKLLFIFMPWHS